MSHSIRFLYFFYPLKPFLGFLILAFFHFFFLFNLSLVLSYENVISRGLLVLVLLLQILYHVHCASLLICVATYPSAGGRREGSRVRLLGEEDARSRHQRLFGKTSEKPEKDVVYEL